MTQQFPEDSRQKFQIKNTSIEKTQFANNVEGNLTQNQIFNSAQDCVPLIRYRARIKTRSRMSTRDLIKFGSMGGGIRIPSRYKALGVKYRFIPYSFLLAYAFLFVFCFTSIFRPVTVQYAIILLPFICFLLIIYVTGKKLRSRESIPMGCGIFLSSENGLDIHFLKAIYGKCPLCKSKPATLVNLKYIRTDREYRGICRRKPEQHIFTFDLQNCSGEHILS